MWKTLGGSEQGLGQGSCEERFLGYPQMVFLKRKEKEFLTNYFFTYELCINFSQIFYTTLNYKIHPNNSC